MRRTGLKVSKFKLALIYIWAPIANFLWYIYTIVMGSLSLLLWPIDKTGAMQHWCARWWCRLIAWTVGARISVHGSENIRADRNYIYMANHCSLLDTPALFAYLPHQFRIMAKKELFLIPFMGWHLYTAGNFPIERGDARKTALSLRKVIDGLKAGKSLMLFPEGTRSPDGRLQEFKLGAFKIALRSKLPIVPVAIRGTHKLLPKHSLAPRPGRVEVIIGNPIETAGNGEKPLGALVKETRDAIAANLDESQVPVAIISEGKQ